MPKIVSPIVERNRRMKLDEIESDKKRQSKYRAAHLLKGYLSMLFRKTGI